MAWTWYHMRRWQTYGASRRQPIVEQTYLSPSQGRLRGGAASPEEDWRARLTSSEQLGCRNQALTIPLQRHRFLLMSRPIRRTVDRGEDCHASLAQRAVQKEGSRLRLLAVLASLAATACNGGDGESSASEETFRIGVMESATGPGETYGRVAIQAKQMAVAEINAAGGINGRMLELVVEDEKCNAQDSITGLQQADRRGRSEDHLGHLVQRRHAGGGALGREGWRGPLLRSGNESRHRQRRRLHLPDLHERRAGGHRYRQRALGRRDPNAGYNHRVDRLRRGREAGFRRTVREARRRDSSRRAVRLRRHRLQEPADKADGPKP